jgi:pilus assembly protein CpaB
MATTLVQPAQRSRTNRRTILAAVALGLLTALLIVVYLTQQSRQRALNSTASVPVVVATQDIAQGASIGAQQVGLRMVTPDAAAHTAFGQTKQVVGLRARYAIPTGAQVVPGMVVQAGSANALSYVVPPGKRAMAVATSDVIGGGNHILPGDFVDVMVTMDAWKVVGGTPPSGGDVPKGTFTILQNVEVLAVANDAEKLGGSGPQASQASQNSSPLAVTGSDANNSVTLAVDPSQAQLLFLTESEGTIRLALRPFGDDLTQNVAPVLEPISQYVRQP